MGPEYFESVLVDYDAQQLGQLECNSRSGQRSTGKPQLQYPFQARAYDPKGEYVKHWLPELRDYPEKVHQPDQLSSSEQEELHLRIGRRLPPRHGQY